VRAKVQVCSCCRRILGQIVFAEWVGVHRNSARNDGGRPQILASGGCCVKNHRSLAASAGSDDVNSGAR
jgi:hypothetical protein